MKLSLRVQGFEPAGDLLAPARGDIGSRLLVTGLVGDVATFSGTLTGGDALKKRGLEGGCGGLETMAVESDARQDRSSLAIVSLEVCCESVAHFWAACNPNESYLVNQPGGSRISLIERSLRQPRRTEAEHTPSFL